MNDKPHPVDYASLVLVAIGALAEIANILPPKYSGAVLLMAAVARLYTKFAGSSAQSALNDGKEIGTEVKQDIGIMAAKRAEPVDPA